MGRKKESWSKEAHERHRNRINQNSEERIDYTTVQKLRIEKMPDIGGRY